jgi:1-acyl-sn-glycerol-3-phosphate acyltransferase
MKDDVLYRGSLLDQPRVVADAENYLVKAASSRLIASSVVSSACSRLGRDTWFGRDGRGLSPRTGSTPFLSSTPGAPWVTAVVGDAPAHGATPPTPPGGGGRARVVGAEPVGSGLRSDWWLAGISPGPLWALRRRPVSLRIMAPPAPPTKRRFGPVYALARLLVTPLYHVLWRVRVEGGEQLPRRGAAIIAANHVSFFDSVVLIMAVRRTLSFIGKVEYLDSWKTRQLLPALGMIPVDRSDGRQAMVGLKRAAGILRAGKMFAIYPEGTRSRDGTLHTGHTGAAYLSIATGAPIVPTGIVGTDRIQPPGTRVPRPFRTLVVRFGTAIEPTAYAGGHHHRRRLITDDVMTAIHALSGQDYNSQPTIEPSPLPTGTSG